MFEFLLYCTFAKPLKIFWGMLLDCLECRRFSDLYGSQCYIIRTATGLFSCGAVLNGVTLAGAEQQVATVWSWQNWPSAARKHWLMVVMMTDVLQFILFFKRLVISSSAVYFTIVLIFLAWIRRSKEWILFVTESWFGLLYVCVAKCGTQLSHSVQFNSVVPEILYRDSLREKSSNMEMWFRQQRNSVRRNLSFCFTLTQNEGNTTHLKPRFVHYDVH